MIKWVQSTLAFNHSPSLNRSCFPAWIQLTYFLSLSTNSVFRFVFAMSRFFSFVQGQKRQGGVNNFKVTLVYHTSYNSIIELRLLKELRSQNTESIKAIAKTSILHWHICRMVCLKDTRTYIIDIYDVYNFNWINDSHNNQNNHFWHVFRFHSEKCSPVSGSRISQHFRSGVTGGIPSIDQSTFIYKQVCSLGWWHSNSNILHYVIVIYGIILLS